MTIFLTDDELVELTGYRQRARQIEWLQRWRVRHTVSAVGRPAVTWTAVQGVERQASAPNFESLRAAP